MYRGTPLQIFLQATFFWMGTSLVSAIVNWRHFVADPVGNVIGWALGAYIFAVIILVGRYFRNDSREVK
ncbi:hypothetical protein FZC33_00350 [Labrys sp. KNU-23]|uniref:hypothetical protein n=1 Tax=Labrys sp. KNU-23 TaxID=2789216 RepID=UPI0011EFF738|nr:hypothetical protein [Labrys sp. KNU-23]QEN84778.1 hypothetical protein FZC33_00350 [Labrys sp. KNU-23]